MLTVELDVLGNDDTSGEPEDISEDDGNTSWVDCCCSGDFSTFDTGWSGVMDFGGVLSGPVGCIGWLGTGLGGRAPHALKVLSEKSNENNSIVLKIEKTKYINIFFNFASILTNRLFSFFEIYH